MNIDSQFVDIIIYYGFHFVWKRDKRVEWAGRERKKIRKEWDSPLSWINYCEQESGLHRYCRKENKLLQKSDSLFKQVKRRLFNLIKIVYGAFEI